MHVQTIRKLNMMVMIEFEMTRNAKMQARGSPFVSTLPRSRLSILTASTRPSLRLRNFWQFEKGHIRKTYLCPKVLIFINILIESLHLCRQFEKRNLDSREILNSLKKDISMRRDISIWIALESQFPRLTKMFDWHLIIDNTVKLGYNQLLRTSYLMCWL